MHTEKRLRVHTLALEVISELAPLIAPIAARDKDLASQLRRAASSCVLNVAEAAYSDPGNRRARLFTAMGSANETRAALEVAVAWRYVEAARTAEVLRRLDRVVASLYCFLHPRRRG